MRAEPLFRSLSEYQESIIIMIDPSNCQEPIKDSPNRFDVSNVPVLEMTAIEPSELPLAKMSPNSHGAQHTEFTKEHTSIH